MEATNSFINFFFRPRGEEIKETLDPIQNELLLDKAYLRSSAADACVSMINVAKDLPFFQKLECCVVQMKYQDCSLRSFTEKMGQVELTGKIIGENRALGNGFSEMEIEGPLKSSCFS